MCVERQNQMYSSGGREKEGEVGGLNHAYFACPTIKNMLFQLSGYS